MHAKFVCRAYDDNGNALPEWLAARAGRLSASEWGAAANINPHISALRLMALKRGLVPPDPENEAMRDGKDAEDLVALQFARAIPNIEVLEKVGALYAHPEMEWMVATPDYFIRNVNTGDLGLLETKVTSTHNAHKWDNNAVPAYMHIQTMIQMGVMGINWSYIACKCGIGGGSQLFIRYIPFEQAVFDQLKTIGEVFMDHMKNGTFPDPDHNDSQLIESLFPQKITDVAVELPDTLAPLFAEWSLLQRRESEAASIKKGLEIKRKKIENILRLSMGSHTHATCGDRKMQRIQINEKPRDAKSYWRLYVR